MVTVAHTAAREWSWNGRARFRLTLGFGIGVVLSAFCAGGEGPACSREEMLRDWMDQDGGGDLKRYFRSERDAALIMRINPTP